MDQYHTDLFSIPAQAFAEHLEIEGNARILFSGRFGMGKTYFLNEFFKREHQDQYFHKDKYEAFHIYPVNYAISQNEDIFEYVKYDILRKMLEKQIEISHSSYEVGDVFSYFAAHNPQLVVKTIAERLLKLGANINKPVDILQKLLKNLRESWIRIDEEIKSRYPDLLLRADDADAFMTGIEHQKGSVYAADVVTSIISNSIPEHLKKVAKKSVLILDDLDRVDPAHIFRLLNVFSAQLDRPAWDKIRLDFDKVILVCDINNIKSIFKSMYGVSTDFNGYIDKFFSREVYHFQNEKATAKLCRKCFSNITAEVSSLEVKWRKTVIESRALLGFKLFEKLVKAGLINLRSLVTRFNFPLKISTVYSIRVLGKTYNLFEWPFILQFYVLSMIVGGTENMKDLLNRIPDRDMRTAFAQDDAVALIVYSNQQLTHNAKATITVNGKKLTVHRSFSDEQKPEASVWAGTDTSAPLYEFTFDDYKYMLAKFIDVFETINFDIE